MISHLNKKYIFEIKKNIYCLLKDFSAGFSVANFVNITAMNLHLIIKKEQVNEEFLK